MRWVIVILALFSFQGIYAQNYDAILIPDSLKENTDAVKRFEEIQVIIRSVDKVIVKRKYAITILNENGNEYAGYVNNYSSMQELGDISGALYDATGKKLKTVKRKDILDEPVTDGVTLARDDRVKKHHFNQRQYPYTVEYEDEQQLQGTYFLPYWSPVEDERFSVQHSRYIVETPKGYHLRYKQLNFPSHPSISETEAVQYQWEMKGVKAMQMEVLQPAFSEIAPRVYIGATDFHFGGYTGNMNTWLDFGKFSLALNKGRDELPEKIKQEIIALVSNSNSIEEKVKRVYTYMQKNTRYISVQLGIGGWQPFDAKYVAANKYGDCKALTNYTISLLKEAGIKANYVLVTAGTGRKGLREDFPAPFFNHVIASVPNGKDTIWLECTSQSNPAGYMGSFTGGRKVLLVDDDGGHVVTTPVYTSNDNQQIRSVQATIDPDGNLQATVRTRFTGLQQELQHSLIHEATKEEREKYLNKAMNLPTYQVNKHAYEEEKDRLPVITEYLDITATNYASVSGKRLFLQPNLFNKSGTKLQADKVRRFPVEFPMAYTDIDSVKISVPDGYTAESVPKNSSFKNDFAEYHISFLVKDHTIEMIRKHIRNQSVIPVENYAEVVKYFELIYKADQSRIVLVRKDG